MLSELTLCSLSPHDPIHASGVGLLPEVPSVLMSIKHLHHGEHSTHSGTRTLCPLIPVLDQHIAVALCPNYCRRIHLRKSISCTTDQLIPMLLTNLAQHLKNNYLGTFPSSFSLGIHLSTPTIGVLGYEQVWLATPHTMAVLLDIPHSRSSEVV